MTSSKLQVFLQYVLLILLFCGKLECARILAVFHTAVHSHYALGNTLVEALADKEHQITMLSPFVRKKPHKNIKDLVLSGLVDELVVAKNTMFDQVEITPLNQMSVGLHIGTKWTNKTLAHPAVTELLNSNEKFDLIILEQFLNEAFYGFCWHFQVPCVMSSTFGASSWTNPQTGNPAPPSFVPDQFLPLSTNMNFFQRIYNLWGYIFNRLFTHFIIFRVQNQLLQKYFPGAPHLSQLYYNASLILLNSHVSTNFPVPLMPNMIEIGGFHVKPSRGLPKELGEFLDSHPEGVVYFSLGSVLKTVNMPIEKRQMIVSALSKIKYGVLFKWEDDDVPDFPTNLKPIKWIPQQDVLAHPNIKLFVTHGGLLSTIEAVYYGVPVVGIPVYGDQEINMIHTESSGFGVGVPFAKLTEDNLKQALHKVLENPEFSEAVKLRSKILHDQPMKPLEKALFWIEYVIRHGGAYHLRSGALNVTWYQYILLDIIALFSILVIMAFLVIKTVLRRLFCKKKSNVRVTRSKKVK